MRLTPRGRKAATVVAVLVGVLLGMPVLLSLFIRLGSLLVGVDAGALAGLQERSEVLAADGEVLGVLHGEIDREVVGLDEMGERIQQAVIAAEDRRFYDHGGYDARAMFRALGANLRAGGVEQGASTISQQLAQIAFLDRDQTLVRKISEVFHAVALERQLDKDEILERYLNSVYFGSGAYGVSAAAEQYFRLPPSELAVEHAALLAAVIRAPERLNPRENPEGARQRRDVVLSAMAAEGFITAAQAEAGRAVPVEVQPRLERDAQAPYAVEVVKREFARLEEFGATPQERLERLFTGGLRVHTTLDHRLQELAGAVVTEAFPDPTGPTAGLVALDPRSGGIRALHGGRDFSELQFDLATQGRRQPGSALKPLVAVAALQAGVRPDVRLVGTGPLTFTLPGTEEGEWEVTNFAGSSHGTVDLARATTQSINTAYAQLSLAVGVDETIEWAQRLGVNVEAAFGEPETWGPSIALGGLTHGVTPLELAVAYGAFADHGRVGPAYLIARVTDPEGETVYEHEPHDREQVLHPGVTRVMVDMLRGVVEEGTGTAAAVPGWEVIGKTGTTQERADAWFVGATATLSTAVWVGHPDAQVPMPGMTGGGVPAGLWHDFTVAALDGQSPRAIPLPDGDGLPDPDPTSVPDLVGLPLGEAMVKAAEAGLVPALADGTGADPSARVRSQRPTPGADALAGDNVTLDARAPAPDPPPDPSPSPSPSPEPEPAPDPEEEEEADEEEAGEEAGEEAAGEEEAPEPEEEAPEPEEA